MNRPPTQSGESLDIIEKDIIDMDKNNDLEDFLNWERQWGDPEPEIVLIEDVEKDSHDEWRDL